MRRLNRLLSPFKALALATVFLLPGICQAALIINVGTHSLAPNTPNQTVQLFVSGNDPVEALNLSVQVADGGPELAGSVDGPTITSCDIVTGTIFAGKSSGVQDPGSFPQLAIRSTTTSTGTVNAQGLLATLKIDTTGFSTGNFALKLSDTLNGDTDFALVPVTINNGTIVVPEPALALAAGLLFLARRRRR